MAEITSIVATVNGVSYDLTNSSGTLWTRSITAPTASSGSNNSGQGPGVGNAASGLGYYPVTIVVTDAYGNSTTITTSTASLGESLKLEVLEKVAPVAAISYPSTGATISSATPTVEFTITDSGSGVNGTEVYIQIDGGTATKISASVSGSTATGSYTLPSALSDGEHTIVIYGYDYDGNVSNSVSSTFIVDTTPPILNITAPEDNLKVNSRTGTVSGTTNDATSTPVTIAITVNGTDQGTVAIADDGSFSHSVSYAEGTNAIVITATDSSGLTTSVTRTVEVSTSAPVVTAITLVPNPADAGATLVISVIVQE